MRAAVLVLAAAAGALAGPGGRAQFQGMPASEQAFSGGHGKLTELKLGEARELLGELLKVVKTPQTQKKLEDALEASKSDPRTEQMRKAFGAKVGPREMAELRMGAIGPILEDITRPVLDKYGTFKGGFMEAVLAIEQAGQKTGDRKIDDGMAFIRQLVTGEKWDGSGAIGKIKEMDVLAMGFGDADDVEREERIEKATALVEGWTVNGKLSKPLAKVYLDTMARIAGGAGVEAEGTDFIEGEISANAIRLRTAKIDQKEKNKLMKRVNILSSFLSPKENARIAKGIMAKIDDMELDKEVEAADRKGEL